MSKVKKITPPDITITLCMIVKDETHIIKEFKDVDLAKLMSMAQDL